MLSGVSYDKIDDQGLHITMRGEKQVLPVDHIVICAGQDSQRALEQPLQQAGKTVHVIGGADLASELDAKRAIYQGTHLGSQL